MRHEYARGFEDGVALCSTKVSDAKTLEEARNEIEWIFWDLHNNKVSALGKEAASVWSYSKEEADLQEKLLEDAKIEDCQASGEGLSPPLLFFPRTWASYIIKRRQNLPPMGLTSRRDCGTGTCTEESATRTVTQRA